MRFRHLFIPIRRDTKEQPIGERHTGDEIKRAGDVPPCPHCGARRVITYKLNGTRCRGCGRPREEQRQL